MAAPGQPTEAFDLARRATELQEWQVQRAAELQEFQAKAQDEYQRRELELRSRAQQQEFELRRLALDRADANEKAASKRLENADQARIDFAHRGQSFAMWLAGGSTVVLLTAGLLCIFLAVASVIAMSLGLAAGGILLAGGLFAGIANLVRHFLPRD